MSTSSHIPHIPDSYSMNEAIVVILKAQPGVPMTARELATALLAARPEWYRRKRERSQQTFVDDNAFKQQIVAEIGSKKIPLIKMCPQIRTTATRPRGYVYLTGASQELKELLPPTVETKGADSPTSALLNPLDPVAPPKPAKRFSEADMYPALSRYLLDEHDIRTKRIDEKRSANRRGNGGNKWLHPDLVGVETAWSGWNTAVRECAKTLADLRARQWSFEVKISIHLGNVRESYFQAVSNSSWSNFGYLVAAQVDEAVMSEIRMLYAAHGVGLIVLDMENPSESEIVIPARERMNIDWLQVNRLAEENRDFMEFVNLVRQFHLIGEVKNEDWDARPGPEAG